MPIACKGLLYIKQDSAKEYSRYNSGDTTEGGYARGGNRTADELPWEGAHHSPDSALSLTHPQDQTAHTWNDLRCHLYERTQ